MSDLHLQYCYYSPPGFPRQHTKYSQTFQHHIYNIRKNINTPSGNCKPHDPIFISAVKPISFCACIIWGMFSPVFEEYFLSRHYLPGNRSSVYYSRNNKWYFTMERLRYCADIEDGPVRSCSVGCFDGKPCRIHVIQWRNIKQIDHCWTFLSCFAVRDMEKPSLYLSCKKSKKYATLLFWLEAAKWPPNLVRVFQLLTLC